MLRGRKKQEISNKVKYSLLVGVVCVTVIILGNSFYSEMQDKKNQADYHQQLNQEEKEQRDIAKEQKETLMKNSSFYQKLKNGLDVKILIVGDSIGLGHGKTQDGASWGSIVRGYLEKTYGGRVEMTNGSLEQATSYAGYARVMSLGEEAKFDLVIICAGQNDTEQNLATHYEAIVRAVSMRFPQCSMISVLENTQKDATNKIQTIQNICSYYGIPVVDTILAFQSSNEQLVNDNNYPNDKGQEIYAEEIEKIIDEYVMSEEGFPSYERDPMNEETLQYKNCQYIKKSKFTRTDSLTYILDIETSGILGMDYSYQSGKNKTRIYVDDKPFVEQEFEYDSSSSRRTFSIVSKTCEIKKQIKIEFGTKAQADGFRGIAISNEEQARENGDTK